MTSSPCRPNLTLAALVADYAIPYHAGTCAVVDQGLLTGTIAIAQVQRVPRERWAACTVRDIMTTRGTLAALAPEQTATDAVAALARVQRRRDTGRRRRSPRWFRGSAGRRALYRAPDRRY